jgi:hypothetical protein
MSTSCHTARGVFGGAIGGRARSALGDLANGGPKNRLWRGRLVPAVGLAFCARTAMVVVVLTAGHGYSRRAGPARAGHDHDHDNDHGNDNDNGNDSDNDNSRRPHRRHLCGRRLRAGQQGRQSAKGAPLALGAWPCFADRRLKRAAEPRPCTRSLCATGRLISISTSAPHPTTARAARTARTADEAAASWLSAALDWTTLGPQSCTGDVLAAHHRHVSPSQPTLDRRPSTVDRRPSTLQWRASRSLLDCACSQRRRGGFQGSSN